MIVKKCIEILIEKKDLSAEQMRKAMEEIMDGNADSAVIGAFLSLLRCKGETVEEITAAASVMRDKSEKISIEGDLLDTCSTGGTGINHFNISTAASFVAAGCGLKVAKHGNRAVSGRCGSADVLEKLGVCIQLPPHQVKKCIEKAGIGFLFAPIFHRAMKNVAVPRRELGIRTVFNILGPLTNPAGASFQLLGVFDAELAEPLARVLGNLGVKKAMVVHGAGGMDEVSLAGPSLVCELKEGDVRRYEIGPDDFGLKRSGIDEIAGGNAEINALAIKKILKGEKGAFRDIVLANTSAALVTAGRAENFKDGVEIARCSLDSGSALKKLKELISISGE